MRLADQAEDKQAAQTDQGDQAAQTGEASLMEEAASNPEDLDDYEYEEDEEVERVTTSAHTFQVSESDLARINSADERLAGHEDQNEDKQDAGSEVDQDIQQTPTADERVAGPGKDRQEPKRVHDISTHNTSKDSEAQSPKRMRDEDPVDKPEETRQELMQRLREVIREDDEERKEENKQNEYEDSQKKVHWTKKKKRGPKKTEEDEKLLESFPDGQVNCDSNIEQCILILLFSVSAVWEKG